MWSIGSVILAVAQLLSCRPSLKNRTGRVTCESCEGAKKFAKLVWTGVRDVGKVWRVGARQWVYCINLGRDETAPALVKFMVRSLVRLLAKGQHCYG